MDDDDDKVIWNYFNFASFPKKPPDVHILSRYFVILQNYYFQLILQTLKCITSNQKILQERLVLTEIQNCNRHLKHIGRNPGRKHSCEKKMKPVGESAFLEEKKAFDSRHSWINCKPHLALFSVESQFFSVLMKGRKIVFTDV